MVAPGNQHERFEDVAARARQVRSRTGADPANGDEPPAEAFDGLHTLLAKRAFWNAVLGIFFLPGILSIVALNHLREYRETPGSPSARARAYAIAATVLLPLGFLSGLIVATMLLEALFCVGGGPQLPPGTPRP